MRVAVTTAVDRADSVAVELQAAGLDPVLLPCIRVEPAPVADLDRIREAALAGDLVILTSARAVRITWPDGMPPDLPVAAVGEGTAAEVRRRGGSVEVMGVDGGESLVRLLAPRVAGRTVVFPRADRLASPIVEELRFAGARVVDVAVYTTVPVGPALDAVDAASFASPSAVEGWSLARSFEGVVVAALGATTRAALAARGVGDVIVPERPGFGMLARTLAEATS